MAPPDPEENPHGISRVVVVGALLLVIIAGFALWQARPLYKWIQDRRAEDYLTEINDALEEQQFSEAHAFLGEAYELSPNNPGILRAAAQLAIAAKSHEAFFFLTRLDELNLTTFQDRILRCEAYLRLNYLERAEMAVRELLAEAPDNHDCLSLAVDIQVGKTDYKSAINALVTLLKSHGDDLRRKLQLATLLIDEGSANDRSIGSKYLWELARGDTPVSALALDRICEDDSLIKPMQKSLVALIEKHPRATERHHVHAMKVRTLLYPLQREKIISEGLARSRTQSAHDAAEFFRWLSEENEYPLILRELPLERARQSSRIMPIYLNALGHENRWREAKSLLEDPRTPLSDPRRLTLAAFCAEKLGEAPIELEVLLQRAMRAAKQSSHHMEALHAAKLAEDLELYETAIIGYDLAQQDARIADDAFEGLIRIAEQSGDTLQIREVTKRFVRRFPRRNDLFERYLYLNMLSGMEIEATLDEALKLVAEEPSRATPRIIAALGFFRLKNFESAKLTCAPCKIETLDPAQRLVYAAVAARTGQEGLAKKIVENVDASSLLEEEKQLKNFSQNRPLPTTALSTPDN